jgi:hypothetical protein
MWNMLADWGFVLKLVVVLGAIVVIATNVHFAPAPTPPVVHDYGRMLTVFDQFCDGYPDNPTPLRCARVVWCWTHQQKEAQDWPLVDAIPFLKKLEASTW